MEKRKQMRDGPRTPFKNVNFTRLVLRAILIFAFIGITFACSYWRDEGILNGNAAINFLANAFSIFQFPALYIFYKWGFYTWTTYIVGLFINAYLYSLIIGAILFILSLLANKENYYIFKQIGLTVVVIGILLVIFALEINVIAADDKKGSSDWLVWTGMGVILFGWLLLITGFKKVEKEPSIK